MKKIRVLETFSGIGAPRKALERLGFDYEIVDSIEIDPYPVKAYNAIFGDNIVPQDITKWNKTKEEIGEVDLLWNSSPCTDISIAGKNEGAKKGSETRSSLVWEVIKIAERIQPKYIIWENVKNLTSPKHISVLNEYIGDLEKIGYKSTYKVLNAKDYGIPQNRERVFVVSILNGNEFEFPEGTDCNNKIEMVNVQQKVRVRKYVVDTDKLKEELRSHKNISNKEIAEKLNKPVTLVEHWFRKDNCFSIPDEDIWFELKKLLNIETNEFDEAITTFEEKDNIYEKSNRLYCDTGLAPTITCAGKGEKIIETFVFPPKQELKLRLKDMLEDKVDEKYYLSDELLDKIKFEIKQFKKDNEHEINEVIRKYGVFDTEKNKHQAGSVYDKNGIAPTLDTMQGGWRQPCIEVETEGFVEKHYKNFIRKNGYVPDMFNPYNESEIKDVSPTMSTQCGSTTSSATVLVKEKPRVIGGIGEKKSNSGRQWYQQDRIYDNEIGLSISTKFNPYYIDNEFRIRRLTPLETFRLMGFDDSDFYKAKETGLSDSRLYKMAGNSIVVNVVGAIFKNLFYEYYIPPIIYIEDEEHE